MMLLMEEEEEEEEFWICLGKRNLWVGYQTLEGLESSPILALNNDDAMSGGYLGRLWNHCGITAIQ
jgi:hypothetical protein